MPDDEKPIPRSELEAWRKKAVDTLRVCYRDSVTAETADQTLRLIREVERLREGVRPFAHFADQWDKHPISGLNTSALYTIHAGEDEAVFSLDDCYKARALLPEDDGKEVKHG